LSYTRFLFKNIFIKDLVDILDKVVYLYEIFIFSWDKSEIDIKLGCLMDNTIQFVVNWSVLSDDEAFGQSIEVIALSEGNENFRINGSSSLLLQVLFADLVDAGEAVLGEDLAEFESERDGLSKALDLYCSMLLENKFG